MSGVRKGGKNIRRIKPVNNEYSYSYSYLEEDDLYIFLEQRWIITISFNSLQLGSNTKQRISRSLTPSNRSRSTPYSDQQRQQSQDLSPISQRKVDSSYNRAIREMVYRFAIEEIISSYYPMSSNINVKLEQIEDQVIIQQGLLNHNSQVAS